jgi:hypothetical protein
MLVDRRLRASAIFLWLNDSRHRKDGTRWQKCQYLANVSQATIDQDGHSGFSIFEKSPMSVGPR